MRDPVLPSARAKNSRLETKPRHTIEECSSSASSSNCPLLWCGLANPQGRPNRYPILSEGSALVFAARGRAGVGRLTTISSFIARLPDVTTEESLLTPPGDRPKRPGGAWPVLARIPEVAAAGRPAPQRPARPGVADGALARASDYRFDPPQPRRLDIAVAMAAPSEPTKQSEAAAAAPASRRPAPHLYQRIDQHQRIDQPAAADAAPPGDRLGPVDSPALPAWDPFTIPGRRLSETLAPIVSFLLLVALFTAAGTSVLMLRSTNRQPAAESQATSTKTNSVEPAVAGPTATGPTGLSGARLEVDTDSQAHPTASPALAPATTSQSPLPLTPADNDHTATSDVSSVDMTPPGTAMPESPDYHESRLPELHETNERPLPQAQMSDPRPAVTARLSGEIQAVTPR